MRKLASIRIIKEIVPIDGADKIELAKIDGWQCIVSKGEFSPGDHCVYFEVDSFLPVRPEFEFLRKMCFRSTQHLGDGFRIKTIRLRGQLSQGLAIPVRNFPLTGQVGDDMTEVIGVKKWEDPIHASLGGKVRGNFPSFISKTDQERIQNLYDKYKAKYEHVPFRSTIKLDGSSMTVYWNDQKMGVCSRNLDLEETPDNTFWKVARSHGMETLLSLYGKNIALQGELMGPGIQGNREQLKDHQFFLFDIYLIDEHRYATNEEYGKILFDLDDIFLSNVEGHGIKIMRQVPLVEAYTFPFKKTLDELLQAPELIKSITHPVAEGLVYNAYGYERFTFKVINNTFLLSEK